MQTIERPPEFSHDRRRFLGVAALSLDLARRLMLDARLARRRRNVHRSGGCSGLWLEPVIRLFREWR